jgi:very-short-patch-repair endonuclease
MPKYQVSKLKRGQARHLRRISTDVEQCLWQLLRSRQLVAVKFRRQVPIGPWIVDFVAFEQMIVVEADGGQHAESTRDQTHDAGLQSRGFRILRFWNNDIVGNTDGVLQLIVEAIANSPSPRGLAAATLSHKGRG